MKKIYLAHLYSLGAFLPNGEIDKKLLDYRFEHSNMMAARIMEEFGHIVFSPISHSHSIQNYCDPKNWIHRFWLKQDKAFLEWCDELWLATDENDPYDWQRSLGVRWEKFLMYRMKKISKEVWIRKNGQLCLTIL